MPQLTIYPRFNIGDKVLFTNDHGAWYVIDKIAVERERDKIIYTYLVKGKFQWIREDNLTPCDYTTVSSYITKNIINQLKAENLSDKLFNEIIDELQVFKYTV